AAITRTASRRSYGFSQGYRTVVSPAVTRPLDLIGRNARSPRPQGGSYSYSRAQLNGRRPWERTAGREGRLIDAAKRADTSAELYGAPLRSGAESPPM